jgi:hypothetical protein
MYPCKSMGGAVYRPWEVKKRIKETEDEENYQQTKNVLKVQYYN